MTISYNSKQNQRTIGDELQIYSEPHTIGITGLITSTPNEIRLLEVPLQTSPSTIVIPTFTEVTTTPGTNEFLVDYANGRITFNAVQEGHSVSVTYKGRGSEFDAEDINEVQIPLGLIANIDGSLSSGVVTPTSISTSITDNFTFPNNVTVNGNLIVNGTTTTIESTVVTIADNIILLDSNVTGTPSLNSGFQVHRGTSPDVQLVWNETDDAWTMNNTSGTPILEAYDTGTVEVAGVLKLPDGSVSNPALTFSNESGSGLYRVSSGTLGLTIGGVEVLEINSTSVNFKQLQALQFVPEKRASDPGSPVEGQIWYRTDSHQLLMYNGTSNVILG